MEISEILSEHFNFLLVKLSVYLNRLGFVMRWLFCAIVLMYCSNL